MDVSVEDNLIAYFGERAILDFSDQLDTMNLDGSNVQKLEIALAGISGVIPISEADEQILWFKEGTTYSVKYDGTDLTSCPDVELNIADEARGESTRDDA